MSITKKFLCKKSLKIASTLVVILTFILGANSPALATPDLQIESLDENNIGAQESPQEYFVDFPTSDVKNDAAYEDAFTSAETPIDKARLHFFSLTMPQLENRERNIIVYLPSDYQTVNNSYPVIYILDAQNLFMQSYISPEDRTLNETLFQFYTRAFDREAIIVGIESDPIYVWDEYGPWVNQNMYLWMDPYEANQVEGGDGDAFLDFMIQTLKPVIDGRYRTLTERESTSIGGSKMGGLLSIYAGLTRPEVFSTAMAMSPAVWFAESGQTWLSGNHLLIFIDRNGVPDNVKFYLDVDSKDWVTDLVERPAIMDSQGSKISFPQAYIEGTQAIVDVLIRRGLSTSRIMGGINTPTEWIETDTEWQNESVVQGDALEFFTYLPLIMNHKIPPLITSPATATFTKSSPSSFTITTSGYPIPTITYSGTLPTGISLTNNGNGTATLSGTPTVTGTFTLTITAQNGVSPNATQTFTLKVVMSPLITSASSAKFIKSSLNSFTVTTTGYPTPTITESGTLPTGVEFEDNGNGTATISGYPTTTGTYYLTITAQNSAGSEQQTFTLKVIEGCPDSGSCLLTFSISMTPLSRTRNITVYLPPNYNSGASYPVIYQMDAQHVFGYPIANVEPLDDWEMDETLDSYYSSMGKGIIVVGIWFDTHYPWSEYTITPNLNMDHWYSNAIQIPTPEGGAMIAFIKDKLKPEIDSRFHTLTDRDHTAIAGGSRCALLALYAGLLKPETFSRVMAMSPAVWIAESKNEAHVPLPSLTTWFSNNGLGIWFTTYQAPINVKYFLSIGTNEQSGYDLPYVQTSTNPGVQIPIQYAYLNGAQRVRTGLTNDGVTSIKYMEISGGTHHASVWNNTIIPHVLPFFGY